MPVFDEEGEIKYYNVFKVISIEKGVCTVSIGAYAAVLFSLGMEKDLELLGADEEKKRRYRELNLKMRKRAMKRHKEKKL